MGLRRLQKPQPLTVGSLFSGIGGFDLGFERAGFEIRWMCEIDPFCRKVLKKHWPEVPIYEDIRTLRGDASVAKEAWGVAPNAPGRRSAGSERIAAHIGANGEAGRFVVEPVDVLIGGFPCQDISLAGKGAGLDGARSGLWWEFYRLIGELRPRYVCLENVAALVIRGLPAILGALSQIGYDAEWAIVSAASVGAPHLRERLFVVAYPTDDQSQGGTRAQGHDTGEARSGHSYSGRGYSVGNGQDVADATSQGQRAKGCSGKALSQPGALERSARCGGGIGQEWAIEPNVGRVANGVSRRVDRLRGLGNAVVPQVAEYIGRCIMRHASR